MSSPNEFRRNSPPRAGFSSTNPLMPSFGSRVAEAFGDAHEKESSDPIDSAVDQWNNLMARDYAGKHRAKLRSLARRDGLYALMKSLLSKGKKY